MGRITEPSDLRLFRAAVRATVCAGAMLLVAAGCATNPSPSARSAGVDADGRSALVDERELVVLLDSELAIEPLRDAALARDYEVRDETVLASIGLHILTLTIPPRLTGPEAIAEIETIEPRSTAGVNHAFRTPPAAAAKADLQYVDAMLSWPVDGCLALAPVGLIDAKVDAAALDATRTRVKTFTDDEPAATRHGDDVAAILTRPSRLRGVELYNAVVVGETAEAGPAAGVDAIVKAIDWLAANDVSIVNISLAGPYNKILDRGLSSAAARGMIIVAAVGNAGADAPPLYPAALESVLAVTAIDAEADIYARAVQGDHVDVAAPGVDILLDDRDRARFATGTSFAAPLVTAKIAADPALSQAKSVEEVRRRLAATATDLGAPGVDDVFGAGLVGPPRNCRPARSPQS